MKTFVLIVDGDGWQREVLAAALAYEGYRTEQVGNAASALAMVARQRFQLVILDPAVPSTGGWETVEKLVLLHPELPVIVFAPGGGTSPSRTPGGASEIIPKPINFSALRNALRRALRPPAETIVVQCFDREQPGSGPTAGRGAVGSSLLNG